MVRYHYVALTRESLCLLSGYSPQMFQVALVTNEHNDNIRIGVVAKFLEPAGNIGIRRVLSNIIDEESAHRTAVVAA